MPPVGSPAPARETTIHDDARVATRDAACHVPGLDASVNLRARLSRTSAFALSAACALAFGLAAGCGSDTHGSGPPSSGGSGGSGGISTSPDAGHDTGPPVAGRSSGSAGEAGAGAEEPDVLESPSGHGVSQGRVSHSLNGAWRFSTDTGKQGEAAGYFQQSFDDTGWRDMAVPGSWNLHDEQSEYEGLAWYRFAFETPAELAGVARLHFDAAYYDVKVWLNGQLLGSHSGGYTPFEFDVTDKLAPSGASNTIAVSADNSYNVGAWYFWGGLTRPVSLDVDQPVRIERQKVVATPDLVAGTASVSIVVTVSNSSSAAQSVTLGGTLESESGQALATLEPPAAPLSVPAGSNAEATLTAQLTPGSFELWHIDRPTLYRSRVRVEDGAGAAYELYDQFGIRRIELVGTEFRLNGEAVRLAGYNRVADDRVEGSSEPRYLVRRDLDRMKAAGANLTRIFHVPEAPELLDYADRIGVLLVCEVPVWGSGADLAATNLQPQRELEEMIHRDANHPAIFAWSVANEIASTSAAGRAFVQRHIDYVRENLDDSRLLTIASNQFNGAASGADEALQYTDFTGGNSYGGFAQAADKLHSLYPDRPALMTEFSPDSFTFGVLRETLEHTTGVGSSLRQLDAKPWLFGASVWTFNDYRSTYAGTSSNHARGWGIQDMWGGQKRAYFQAQAAFAPVASLTLTSGAVAGNDRSSTIQLMPRGGAATSIPSFTLRGYRLLWQAVNDDGEVVTGQIFELDEVTPGGTALELPVTWSTAGESIVEEQVSLLNPTGHEVAVSKVALAPPKAPVIEQVVTGDGAVRVVFEHVPGASLYRLEASAGGPTLSESVEYSSNIYLGGLTNGSAYTLRLVAENAQGQAESDPLTVTPAAALGPVSPRLQAIVPVRRGFVLGYIVNNAVDAGWEIEVQDGLTENPITTYTTTTIAVTRYDQLEPNHPYRVRLRMNDAGGVSAWSEWLDVHTLGEGYSVPAVPLLGVLAGARSLALRIVPAPGAERYLVTASPTAGGASVSRTFERSAVDALLLDGLAPATSYDVTVQAQTPNGLSTAATIAGSTL